MLVYGRPKAHHHARLVAPVPGPLSKGPPRLRFAKFALREHGHRCLGHRRRLNAMHAMPALGHRPLVSVHHLLAIHATLVCGQPLALFIASLAMLVHGPLYPLQQIKVCANLVFRARIPRLLLRRRRRFARNVTPEHGRLLLALQQTVAKTAMLVRGLS